jgi:3-hydroxyisobutyrate dehydrogenase-like beta-hydroxyacid dehydrogenase
MARRIIEAGYPMTLWARRSATLAPFADTSAKVAASPAELARTSDLVCLCVVGDADVDEVTTGDGGLLTGLQPGSMIAVHSTVHPKTCQLLTERAATRRVFVVDAPVSGGGPAAAEGRLLVMVGGDTDAVERCRPVFETYAESVVHLGGPGSGQVTKLLNNLLFTANLGTAATALEFGQALGIAPDRLAGALSRASGNSFALNTIAQTGGTLDRLAPLAGPLLHKDVRLVAELAQTAATPPGAVLDAAEAALTLLGHPR